MDMRCTRSKGMKYTYSFVLPKNINEMIREMAYKKYGGKKGSLSKVVEEAVLEYYKTNIEGD